MCVATNVASQDEQEGPVERAQRRHSTREVLDDRRRWKLSEVEPLVGHGHPGTRHEERDDRDEADPAN